MRLIWKDKEAPAPPCTNEQLKGLFLHCDKNGDGHLSREELKDAFRRLGAYIPSYRAHRALHCADKNGDGYISDDEVEDLVKYASKHYHSVFDLITCEKGSPRK